MKALAEEGPRSYNPPDGLVILTLKDQQHEQRGLIGGMLTRANAEAAIANGGIQLVTPPSEEAGRARILPLGHLVESLSEDHCSIFHAPFGEPRMHPSQSIQRDRLHEYLYLSDTIVGQTAAYRRGLPQYRMARNVQPSQDRLFQLAFESGCHELPQLDRPYNADAYTRSPRSEVRQLDIQSDLDRAGATYRRIRDPIHGKA